MSDLPGAMPPRPMPPGSNVMPFPGMMPQQQPQMMLNPAFQQWMQLKQAWDAETQRRQKQFEDACALIRSDAAKSYKIDIEADSTVAADEQAEKEARTEFLKAIVPFMEVMVPQMQQNPAIAPLAAEMIKFAFNAFPASRQLEDALETALQKMQQMPPQPPPQAQHGKSPMELQLQAQEAQGKQQTEMATTQIKAQTDQQNLAVKQQQIAAEAQIERERMAMAQQRDAADFSMKGREMEGREQLEAARIQRLDSMNTRGLV